jgi:hypothetical protein
MEKKYKLCQSCGMPLKKDRQGGGTNADGSKSEKYCSYCYQNGRFSGENLTVKEFQEYCRKEMIKDGYNRFLAWLFTRGMKCLERWKKN